MLITILPTIPTAVSCLRIKSGVCSIYHQRTHGIQGQGCSHECDTRPGPLPTSSPLLASLPLRQVHPHLYLPSPLSSPSPDQAPDLICRLFPRRASAWQWPFLSSSFGQSSSQLSLATGLARFQQHLLFSLGLGALLGPTVPCWLPGPL